MWWQFDPQSRAAARLRADAQAREARSVDPAADRVWHIAIPLLVEPFEAALVRASLRLISAGVGVVLGSGVTPNVGVTLIVAAGVGVRLGVRVRT